MRAIREAIYQGTVSHKRLRPTRHALSYKVFSLLFDVEKLDALTARLRFFSRNRFNLVSFYEKDHGNGKSLAPYLHDIAAKAERPDISRFMMLCYPRILGFAFNPLTVYYGLDKTDTIRLVIYEVRNTFGERETYVLPADSMENGVIWQSCAKRFYVSPFNDVSGEYSFHLTPPGEKLSLGVALKDDDGPVLNAIFTAKRLELTDKTLLAMLAQTGWMTVNVVFSIHWEALKLGLKGMKLKPRPKHHGQPVNMIDHQHEPKPGD